MTEHDACFNFFPDAEHINALPEQLRRYIHDLHTRCDLNGEVREIWQLREQNKQLQAKIEELLKEKA